MGNKAADPAASAMRNFSFARWRRIKQEAEEEKRDEGKAKIGVARIVGE